MWCGESGTENTETYPVKGVVKLNDAPVAGATGTLLPQSVSGGHPEAGSEAATGKTDDSGRYQLATFVSNDGTLRGKCQVMIAKYEQQGAQGAAGAGGGSEVAIPEDAGYAPPGDVDAVAPPPKNLLPEKYADYTRSGLTAEVVAGENTPKDFKLTEG